MAEPQTAEPTRSTCRVEKPLHSPAQHAQQAGHGCHSSVTKKGLAVHSNKPHNMRVPAGVLSPHGTLPQRVGLQSQQRYPQDIPAQMISCADATTDASPKHDHKASRHLLALTSPQLTSTTRPSQVAPCYLHVTCMQKLPWQWKSPHAKQILPELGGMQELLGWRHATTAWSSPHCWLPASQQQVFARNKEKPLCMGKAGQWLTSDGLAAAYRMHCACCKEHTRHAAAITSHHFHHSRLQVLQQTIKGCQYTLATQLLPRECHQQPTGSGGQQSQAEGSNVRNKTRSCTPDNKQISRQRAGTTAHACKTSAIVSTAWCATLPRIPLSCNGHPVQPAFRVTPAPLQDAPLDSHRRTAAFPSDPMRDDILHACAWHGLLLLHGKPWREQLQACAHRLL